MASSMLSLKNLWPLMLFAMGTAVLSGMNKTVCQPCLVMCAAAEPNPEPVRPSDKVASAARLAVMRSRVLSLTAELQPDKAEPAIKLEVIEPPLLRYSNPAAEIVTDDATVWAWGRMGRPRMLASVEAAGCEVVSLSAEPVCLRGKSGLAWSSKSTSVQWQRVPNTPKPADSATARARQMKDIIGRFSATGRYDTSGITELRPLVRSLHRYENATDGILDGGIFAFTAGTNPEVFILLESRNTGKEPSPVWYYACARLSAGALEARLDKKVVWECPAIKAWDIKAPYCSLPFGKADVADEDELAPKD